MKARVYVETKFIPWILFLDTKDTIKHFTNLKEEYLFETYNHISTEFKAIERYELYMFRVTFSNALSPNGIYELIVCKTPEVKNVGESACLIIAYNKDDVIYYNVELLLNGDFQINKIKPKQKDIVSIVSKPNMDDIIQFIKNDLLEE